MIFILSFGNVLVLHKYNSVYLKLYNYISGPFNIFRLFQHLKSREIFFDPSFDFFYTFRRFQDFAISFEFKTIFLTLDVQTSKINSRRSLFLNFLICSTADTQMFPCSSYKFNLIALRCKTQRTNTLILGDEVIGERHAFPMLTANFLFSSFSMPQQCSKEKE